MCLTPRVNAVVSGNLKTVTYIPGNLLNLMERELAGFTCRMNPVYEFSSRSSRILYGNYWILRSGRWQNSTYSTSCWLASVLCWLCFTYWIEALLTLSLCWSVLYSMSDSLLIAHNKLPCFTLFHLTQTYFLFNFFFTELASALASSSTRYMLKQGPAACWH